MLGDRFTFEFRSVIYAEMFTVTIAKEGYVGSVTALPFVPGRDFCILAYDREEPSVLFPIRGAQLRLKLTLSASQLTEFLAAAATDFKVTVTGTNFSWHGWYQPQESLVYNPYALSTIELTFSDLSILKTKLDSINLDAEAIIEKQSIDEHVTRQLNYTGLSLSFDWQSSVYHEDYTGDHIKDVVHLERMAMYKEDGSDWQDSYTLISRQLKIIHSVLWQEGGYWRLYNLIDRATQSTPVPPDFFSVYKPVARDVNIRYANAESSITVKCDHYPLRHNLGNRDFQLWIGTTEPIDWDVPTDFATRVTSGGGYVCGIRGNYDTGTVSSKDPMFYASIVQVEANDILRIFFAYELLILALDPQPQIAIAIDGAGDPYWLREDGTFIQQATAYIIEGADDIAAVLNRPFVAPAAGGIVFYIYRPFVSGEAYDASKSYMRVKYAEVISNSPNEDADFKQHKATAKIPSNSLAPATETNLIGLLTDDEFYISNFVDYEKYVTAIYNPSGSPLTSEFKAAYITTFPYAKSELFARTWARLYNKPQFQVEATVIGQELYIGDVFTINAPGIPTTTRFVVVAYEWDLKNAAYKVILSGVNEFETPVEEFQDFWLRVKDNNTTDGNNTNIRQF